MFTQWIAQHVVPLLSATAVVSLATGWISRHKGFLAGKVADEVAAIDADVLGRIHSPVVKAFLIDVEKAADKAVPGAGDAKYAALTALMMHDLPPSAAPFEGALQAVLEAIGTGAKAGAERVIAPPTAAPGAPTL